MCPFTFKPAGPISSPSTASGLGPYSPRPLARQNSKSPYEMMIPKVKEPKTSTSSPSTPLKGKYHHQKSEAQNKAKEGAGGCKVKFALTSQRSDRVEPKRKKKIVKPTSP